MKPIETVYKGYKFRSRLEARWAVFFDVIGAKWEYEPQGFELSDGTWYLPDFLVHGVKERTDESDEFDLYVEVKPSADKLTRLDKRKFNQFDGRIIIVGDIPFAEKFSNVEGDQLDAFWDSDQYMYNFRKVDGDEYFCCLAADHEVGLRLVGVDSYNGLYPDSYIDERKTIDAYTKARQARFEHGETL